MKYAFCQGYRMMIRDYGAEFDRN